MKLYKKLITSCFLLFFGVLLLSSPIEGAPRKRYRKEMDTAFYDDEEDFYESYGGQRRNYEYAEENEGSPSLFRMVLELSIKRFIEVLSELNPLWFLIKFIFTFPIVQFLIDAVLQKMGRSNQTLSKWQVFIAQAILFYIINCIKNILHIGILKVLLQPLKVFNKVHHLLFIILSTSFMGICILIPSWYMALALLIPLTVVGSITMPPKGIDKKAYLITNILFVIITWLSIQGIWYVLVETQKLDKILLICQIHTSGSNQKKEEITQLLLSNGSLTFFTVWNNIKQYVGIRPTPSTFITLDAVVRSSQSLFILKPIVDFINNLNTIFQQIIYATIRNIVVENIKEWLL